MLGLGGGGQLHRGQTHSSLDPQCQRHKGNFRLALEPLDWAGQSGPPLPMPHSPFPHSWQVRGSSKDTESCSAFPGTLGTGSS